jgi:hypothetical protein
VRRSSARFLCSDLSRQNGDVEPLTTADMIGRYSLSSPAAGVPASQPDFLDAGALPAPR